MQDIASYALPVLLFLVFLALLRRAERRTGRRPGTWQTYRATLEEARRDPRGWVGMAAVVAVFLVALALGRL